MKNKRSEALLKKERIEALLEEVREVHECWRKDVKALPTQLNIIELLHCNENAHSRILVELLKYENGRFMESFLKMSGLKLDGLKLDDLELDIKNAQIALEYTANVDNKNGRIDILIYKPQKYAIIIENKGNGAEEQSEQISRYVRALINEGYKKDNIYCLYLTQEGGIPSENSLNDEEAKNYLAFDREKGPFLEDSRLKPINYKYDILKWLRNDVLPDISYRDKILIDGLNHYIDYLETIYQLKEYKMTNVNQHFQSLGEGTCLESLLDISIYKPLLEQYVKAIFCQMGYKFELYNNEDIVIRKYDSQDLFLIYRDEKEKKFSLGWTNGYDGIFEKDGENKNGASHKWFDKLECLLEELKKRNDKIVEADNNHKK